MFFKPVVFFSSAGEQTLSHTSQLAACTFAVNATVNHVESINASEQYGPVEHSGP